MYGNAESLYCTPETKVPLHVNELELKQKYLKKKTKKSPATFAGLPPKWSSWPGDQPEVIWVILGLKEQQEGPGATEVEEEEDQEEEEDVEEEEDKSRRNSRRMEGDDE